jgi:hypothetical protein
MRHPREKRSRIAAQHRGANADFQGVIRGGDAFQQPDAEESGAAGNEDARPGQFMPRGRRMGEDVFEVCRGQRLAGLAQNPTPRNSPIRSAA